jgi:hypothetical protein
VKKPEKDNKEDSKIALTKSKSSRFRTASERVAHYTKKEGRAGTSQSHLLEQKNTRLDIQTRKLSRERDRKMARQRTTEAWAISPVLQEDFIGVEC